MSDNLNLTEGAKKRLARFPTRNLTQADYVLMERETLRCLAAAKTFGGRRWLAMALGTTMQTVHAAGAQRRFTAIGAAKLHYVDAMRRAGITRETLRPDVLVWPAGVHLEHLPNVPWHMVYEPIQRYIDANLRDPVMQAAKAHFMSMDAYKPISGRVTRADTQVALTEVVEDGLGGTDDMQTLFAIQGGRGTYIVPNDVDYGSGDAELDGDDATTRLAAGTGHERVVGHVSAGGAMEVDAGLGETFAMSGGEVKRLGRPKRYGGAAVEVGAAAVSRVGGIEPETRQPVEPPRRVATMGTTMVEGSIGDAVRHALEVDAATRLAAGTGTERLGDREVMLSRVDTDMLREDGTVITAEERRSAMDALLDYADASVAGAMLG